MTLTKDEIDALPSRYVHKKAHLPYDQAKHCVKTLAPHVTGVNKYRKWIKDTKSYFMPIHPERVYPGFSWSDFLDSNVKPFSAYVIDRKRENRSLWDAIRWSQRYCLKNGITRRKEWESHYDSADDIPHDIPKYPHAQYAPDYPGFAVWCGKSASAITEAVSRVRPILTLVHPVNCQPNVAQAVVWSNGLSELRETWKKQDSYDRIVGCWFLEEDRVNIDSVLAELGHYDGERYTFPNMHQVTWELNSLLEMVRIDR